jgi:hypothetical protein
MENKNSDEEFMKMDDFLINKDKPEENCYSNFSDVIRDDYLKLDNLDNLENKEKYLYQPQFKEENICQLKIVGYSDKGVKPVVKINEFNFLYDKWLIIAHLFNLEDINNMKDHLDIISIVLNKEDYDMKISLRYIITEKITKDKFNGNFAIFFAYKKSENEELIKIRDLDKFPGNNKAIEFLVKELINPIIIDKYE